MASVLVPVAHLTDEALAAELRSPPSANPMRRRACQQEALSRLPVRPLVGGGYVVRSRTTAGAWWLVELHRTIRQPSVSCTCPADTERCHHVRQVESYCRLTTALSQRPTPPPNVGGLVD